MIEAFPLQKVIPMLLKGSGDCTAVDWTFLGLSIANWSFINFVTMVGAIILVWCVGVAFKAFSRTPYCAIPVVFAFSRFGQ